MPGENPHPDPLPDVRPGPRQGPQPDRAAGTATPRGPSARRGSPAARREALRAKAREVRLREQRREQGGTLLVRAGVLTGGVALVTAAAVALVTAVGPAPAMAVPANAADDGVRVGAGMLVERSAPCPAGEAPSAEPAPAARDVADVVVWVDYHCPACKEFELENAAYLEQLVTTGAATVRVHPVAITDGSSRGARYASRAAGAALCVADLSPDQFWRASDTLFLAQPAPGDRGLTDEQLAALVTGLDGVDDAAALAECVDERRFVPWVGAATARAFAGPLPTDDLESLRGTPTVLVNGELFDASQQTFPEFVTTVLGDAYAAEQVTR